jgi:hypothetical protein
MRLERIKEYYKKPLYFSYNIWGLWPQAKAGAGISSISAVCTGKPTIIRHIHTLTATGTGSVTFLIEDDVPDYYWGFGFDTCVFLYDDTYDPQQGLGTPIALK